MSSVGPSDTAIAPNSDPRFLNRLAWVKRWSDRFKSVEHATLALGAADALEEGARCCARADAFRTLSFQAKWRGDFDEALQLGLNAEAEVSEAGNPVLRAWIYSTLGVVHYSRGRLDLAADAVDRGLKILEPVKDPERDSAHCDLLTTRAAVQKYHGKMAQAGLTLSRARELAEGPEVPRVMHNTARLLYAQGEFRTGLEHAEQSLERAIQTENRLIAPYSQEVVGLCAAFLKDHARAEAAFSAGARLATEDNDRRAICQIMFGHGSLELDRGNIEKAIDLLQRGVRISEKMRYALWEKHFNLKLAAAFERTGDLARSLSYHKRAWKIVGLQKT